MRDSFFILAGTGALLITAHGETPVAKPLTFGSQPHTDERLAHQVETEAGLGRVFPGAQDGHLRTFVSGKRLFGKNWSDLQDKSESARWAASSCIECHFRNGRQFSSQAKNKWSEIPLSIFLPQDDPLGATLRPYGMTSILFSRPELILRKSKDAEDGLLKSTFPLVSFKRKAPHSVPEFHTPRMPLMVAGAGLLERILEKDILEESLRQNQEDSLVSGKANMVYSKSLDRESVGRLGWNANSSTVLDVIFRAFDQDFGLSLYDSSTDAEEKSPSFEDLKSIESYIKALAVPRSLDLLPTQKGWELFNQAGCADCHKPSWILPSESLGFESDAIIAPYSDLLLHDMGKELADSQNNREWRTAPLWAIRYQELIHEKSHFLHDGRAKTIEEAILWHGGEADFSRQKFVRLADHEKRALLIFVSSL